MSKLVINGPNRIYGEISVQGAKNSILPILAATILCNGKSIIHNCPKLSDVNNSLNILRYLGCKCSFKNNIAVIDSQSLRCCTIPDSLMLKMRSSIVFLGAILGRCGNAVITSPGGCELGPRPIDLHISALKHMGATVREEYGHIEFNTPNGLKGTTITLSFASVGATENIILAAVTAKGTTVIHNAAKEPEICDMIQFLNSCGAKIYGGGTDTIIINGVKGISGCSHTIIPDRIVAATYMAATAVTGGEILLKNVISSHLTTVSSVLCEAGCELKCFDDSIYFKAPERLKNISMIRTAVHPGFPTDAGPIIMTMLSLARGTSVMVENIFQNRFRYIDELRRFGANIRIEGKIAIVEGVDGFSAAPCKCTDLRGGAALVVAALAAKGKTVISDIYHIKRGYENIDTTLAMLGANINEM